MMNKMKFILGIFFISILPAAIFAQEGTRDQSIELPDFVITGVERVTIPAAEKPKAELVPTLSEEFFKPAYSPEELGIAELSNPVKKEIALFNYSKEFDGRLDVSVGIHTLPFGELTYAENFGNFVLQGKVWGKNEIPDTSFASLNYSGLSLGGHYFVNENSKVLGGTKLEANGGYHRDTYRFMASPNPRTRRDVHYGNFNFGISNLMNQYFKFSADLNDKITYVKDLDVTENNFKIKSFAEIAFSNYSLSGNSNFENQSFNGGGSQQYFDVLGMFNIKLQKDMKVGVGLVSAVSDGNSFFMPAANFSMRFSKFLSLYSEFRPNAQFFTFDEILNSNRYFSGNRANVFMKNKMNLSGALKYEYETYFEINGGVKFGSYEDHPYFSDSLRTGTFELKTIDATEVAAFVNFIFRPGPFGNFYANAELRSLEDEDENQIPYVPSFNADLTYGYKFPFGVGLIAGLKYFSSRYADRLNTLEVSDFTDLSLKLDYDINSYFNVYVKAENILNRENPYWLGSAGKIYDGKPLDLLIGLNYRW